MHEHIFITSPEVKQVWPHHPTRWEDSFASAKASRWFAEARACGIGTIVDLTVFGLGRDAPRIIELARGTAVNIILATGAWIVRDLPYYFARPVVSPRGDADRLVYLFVNDITHGIGDTGVKAAILKCTTDEAGVTRDVERVLRAVAQAHRETGAPIATHTHMATRSGLEQQRIFLEEGVDLSRVIIGHSGDVEDYSYLESILAAGSYVAMDRFGIDAVLPLQDRIRIVATLCRRGYSSRIVLSHDASVLMDMGDREARESDDARRNWTLISRVVLPALLERGVSQDQIDEMMIRNPRAIFERQGSY